MIIAVEWIFRNHTQTNLTIPDWAARLCSHSDEIRSEFLSLYNENLREFRLISPEQARITGGNSWKVFILKAYGRRLFGNFELCPRTSALCDAIPEITSAMFSILEPSTHVLPHRGPYAGVLRCHVPLIIPAGDFGINVDGKKFLWETGKALVFDDTIEHEAWNNTEERRVVLFIDFVRPFPQPLAAINRLMIWLIGRSPFIGRMLRASM